MRDIPTNHSSCQQTRYIDLLYGVRIWAEVSFVLSKFMQLTDGQTDEQMLIAIPWLHSCSAVKIGRLTKQMRDVVVFDYRQELTCYFCCGTLCAERGYDPFDILPEGWLMITHTSGMPIFLHKKLRVCSVSRPYFLGPGSARVRVWYFSATDSL